MSRLHCLLSEVATSAAFFVSFWFWVGLVGIAGQELRADSGGTLMAHAGNLVVALLQLLMTRLPLVSTHFQVCVCVPVGDERQKTGENVGRVLCVCGWRGKEGGGWHVRCLTHRILACLRQPLLCCCTVNARLHPLCVFTYVSQHTLVCSC